MISRWHLLEHADQIPSHQDALYLRDEHRIATVRASYLD